MSSSSEEAEFQGDEEEEEEEEEPTNNDDDDGNDDDDSDDEEDIPLAQLAAQTKNKKKPESKVDKKDMSLAKLASSSRRASKVNYNEEDDDDDDGEDEWEDQPSPKKRKTSGDDDDDDDDDDPPLSALKSTKKKTITNGDKKTKNGSATKSPTAKDKKKAAAPAAAKAKAIPITLSTNDNTAYRCVSDALYRSGCEKGLLIQRILCRWWYAMEWPDPKRLPAEPPAHYDTLDGFPGVYICTSGDKVGHVWDMRDKDKAPNFLNMSNKTSAKLQELLLTALEAQKKELIAHEGEGTATEKEINDMIKWAKRIKPTAADAAAKKVLKAAKLN